MSRQVVLYGPVNNLGYGVVFRNLATALIPMLSKRGISTAIVPKSPPQVHESDMSEAIKHALIAGKSPNHHAISINLWHLHDMAQFSGAVRIGYPIFESNELQSHEIGQGIQLDEIWVPSQWAKDIINEYMRRIVPTWDRCSVIPCGVNTKLFSPDQGLGAFRDDSFLTFVTVGKFEKRKGHELILECMKMLPDLCENPVRLLFSCHNPFIGDFANMIRTQFNNRGFQLADEDRFEQHVRFRHESAPDKCVIDLVTVANTAHDAVSEIYRSGDVGVFPFFAEGWNLPLLECMSCGVPCIANHYSGPTEYLNPNNHISLTETRETIANDGVFFHGHQGTWKAPKLTNLISTMQDVLEGKLDKKLLEVAKEGRETAKKFTWEASASAVIEALENNERTREFVQPGQPGQTEPAVNQN